jgi:hypothetical protein
MIITIRNCRVKGCEGADHKFEFDRPTAREILRIETATGLDIDAFASGLDGAMAKVAAKPALMAMLALTDILHRRDGIEVPFDDIDVDLGAFDIQLEAGEIPDEETDPAGDEAGKGAPAPTRPSRKRAAGAGRASTSGAATKAASARKSAPTPRSSGGSTD